MCYNCELGSRGLLNWQIRKEKKRIKRGGRCIHSHYKMVKRDYTVPPNNSEVWGPMCKVCGEDVPMSNKNN